MNYRIDHIPLSKEKRPGTKITPTTITIHSTANPKSTAKNERAWLTNPTNTRLASWHIVVDEIEAIEAIPLNEIAYHAGNREGNLTSIGIEITESGNREKTIENAVELVAGMLRERSWGVDKLVRHHDWSGKICPRIFADNNWAGWYDFKNRVNNALNKLNDSNNNNDNNDSIIDNDNDNVNDDNDSIIDNDNDNVNDDNSNNKNNGKNKTENPIARFFLKGLIQFFKNLFRI